MKSAQQISSKVIFCQKKKHRFCRKSARKTDSAAETKIKPGERVYGKITKVKELAD